MINLEKLLNVLYQNSKEDKKKLRDIINFVDLIPLGVLKEYNISPSDILKIADKCELEIFKKEEE